MRPFPAIYSTLSPGALAVLLSEKYGLQNVHCKLLVRGVGDTYLVESSSERFILRIYHAVHRSLPQILEELHLLLELKQAKVAVAYPLHDHSGAIVQALNAVEGTRYAALFIYAPGSVARLLNENQLRNLGREMARFHRVSSTMTPGNSRWNFNLDTTLFRPLEMLKPVFAEDPESYTWLKEAAKEVKTLLACLDTSQFSTGYCHFDFLPKNLHFEGDAVTIFDFDFMGHGWTVNDVMTFWQHLQLDVYTGRMTQKAADDSFAIFLDAYRQLHPLSEQELAAIPYLSLGFWLFYMGFHTTHDQFYPFLQPQHLKFYTGLLRRLSEKFWN
jgi:Ser/Thr protein kinase RdoA (MazF antagonist)